MTTKYVKYAVLVIAIWFLSCKHEPLLDPSTSLPTESSTCSADTVYFRQQILPLFVSYCTSSGCHDAATRTEGVLLDSYSNIIKTGKIIAFQPWSSKAYQKIVETDPGDRMPPNNPLTQQQKDLIYKWILQGARNNSCSNICDSSVFTYSPAIKPLIESRCQGCHGGANPQGGIDLSNYAAIKAKVDDGKLWGAINHLPGYSAMPKNGNQLSACELKQFEKWIAAGALDN